MNYVPFGGATAGLVEESALNPERFMRDVETAKRRLAMAKAMRGAPKLDIYGRQPMHIMSRKATSEAIKQVLCDEWLDDLAVKDAETELSRALWKLGAPDWLKELMF
jgi:hypothetical protein